MILIILFVVLAGWHITPVNADAKEDVGQPSIKLLNSRTNDAVANAVVEDLGMTQRVQKHGGYKHFRRVRKTKRRTRRGTNVKTRHPLNTDDELVLLTIQSVKTRRFTGHNHNKELTRFDCPKDLNVTLTLSFVTLLTVKRTPITRRHIHITL